MKEILITALSGQIGAKLARPLKELEAMGKQLQNMLKNAIQIDFSSIRELVASSPDPETA